MSQQNVKTSAPESEESSVLKPKAVRRPAKAKSALAVKQALDKIEIRMIPLSRLVFSHLNVRFKAVGNNVYIKPRVTKLAASIKKLGLLHNLVVHDMNDGTFGVACGGFRLSALQVLLSEGFYEPDQLIPVKLVSEDLARAASLAENNEREDMHPAEQIAGFRALTEEGKSPAQIADLMGYTSRHVQRCLKLTNLAPAILEALAEDKLTLDQCQALTLADSHENQMEVWKKLESYHDDSASTIRLLVTSTETKISRSPKFRFIGEEAYLAAGGLIRTDLFSSDDEGYIDTSLVEQLTAEKLQQIAAGVEKDEGFAWVEVRLDGRLHSWSREVSKSYYLLPEHQPVLTPEEAARLKELRTQLQQSESATSEADLKSRISELEDAGLKRSWADADKTNVGAVICFESGSCFIQRGVQRLADLPKKGKPENKRDMQELSNDYSAALVRSMSCERSLAVQAALSTRPDISIAMLTWTLCRTVFSQFGLYNNPMNITLHDHRPSLVSGSASGEEGKAWQFMLSQKDVWLAKLPENWAQDFQWLLGWSAGDVQGLLGFCSAISVCCFQERLYENSQTSTLDAVETAMGFDLADWWQPTAQGFFKRISKEQIADALTEAGRTGNARDVEKMKRGDAAEFAEQAMKGSRWVPQWMKPLQADAAVSKGTKD